MIHLLYYYYYIYKSARKVHDPLATHGTRLGECCTYEECL